MVLSLVTSSINTCFIKAHVKEGLQRSLENNHRKLIEELAEENSDCAAVTPNIDFYNLINLFIIFQAEYN